MFNKLFHGIWGRLARFFYLLGIAFLIISLVVSVLPTTTLAAKSAVWTSKGDCNNPQDANHYYPGEWVVIRGRDFVDGQEYDWAIFPTNNSDPSAWLASGSVTANDTATYDGYFCVKAYQATTNDIGGPYKAQVSYEGTKYKSDNFNVVAADPLSVSKTAAGSYDRTVSWTLEKSASPTTLTGSMGQTTGNTTWEVVATKTETLGNFNVGGTITINNPNSFGVSFTVNDQLSDGTMATVTCPSYTVAAGDTVNCTYEALPDDMNATQNIATVSVAGYPDRTATASISWTENNLIGYASGTLSDSRFGYSQTISGSKTETFEEAFACSPNAEDYIDGSYKYTVENTALLNDNINLNASAVVTVICNIEPTEYPLTATKTAAGTYDRTVSWTLEKSASPASLAGTMGETAGSTTWEVIATKTETSDNYMVEGTITINNANNFDVPFEVSDQLNDGTTATVTCPQDTIPAEGQVVCNYTAYPDDDSATENTAVVTSLEETVDGTTATASIGWTENLTGNDSGTLSDPRFAYEELISGSKTVSFEEEFVCPSDASLYEDGTYQFTEENIATLNDGINLEASAGVSVVCGTGPTPPPTYTPTPTPTSAPTPTSTPVPTLPPPPTDEPLIIPVTGPETSFWASANTTVKLNYLTNLSANAGFVIFGIGLVFHGISLWKKRKEE